MIDIPEHIILLRGSGTEKIIRLLEEKALSYTGPHGSLREAVTEAIQMAEKGSSVVLSLIGREESCSQ